MFQKFLNTSLNDEKERTLLIEKMAYTFIHHRPVHEITLLCGEGGNGKGVVDTLLGKLHEVEAYAADAKTLTTPNKRNQFHNKKMVLKPYITCTESISEIESTDLLKMLTGGGKANVELKHKNTSIDMDIFGKFILSTNPIIKFYDWDEAVMRRLHFIKMNNKIKQDNKLEEQIHKNELDYVFTYIIKKALLPLIKRNFEFTLPDSHFELLEHYKEHNNNIYSIIKNNIIENTSERVTEKELWDHVADNFSGMFKKRQKFMEKFEDELNKNNIKYEKGTSYGYPCFRGIQLVNTKLEDDETDIRTLYYSLYNSQEIKHITIDVKNVKDIEKLNRKINYFEIRNNIPVPFNFNNVVNLQDYENVF